MHAVMWPLVHVSIQPRAWRVVGFADILTECFGGSVGLAELETNTRVRLRRMLHTVSMLRLSNQCSILLGNAFLSCRLCMWAVPLNPAGGLPFPDPLYTHLGHATVYIMVHISKAGDRRSIMLANFCGRGLVS